MLGNVTAAASADAHDADDGCCCSTCTDLSAGRRALVNLWTREFARSNEYVGLEEVARSADIPQTALECRLARGWSLDQVGVVVRAMVLEATIAAITSGVAEDAMDALHGARRRYALACALFEAMVEREPCPLAELACHVTP
jgi:hypothetical protein